MLKKEKKKDAKTTQLNCAWALTESGSHCSELVVGASPRVANDDKIADYSSRKSQGRHSTKRSKWQEICCVL